MLKKVWVFLMAGALALSLSACGGNAVKLPALDTGNTSSAVSGGSSTSHKKPDSGKYSDDLAGLLSYMEDGGAVTRDAEAASIGDGKITIKDSANTSFTEMSYKEIGALGGYRYRFTYGASTVQAEFYEFDPDNLDEKAQECLGSVKEKGFFQMLDKEVPAILHSNGKYLMIYTDSNAEKKEENGAQKEWAEELFLSFQA